MSVRASLVNCSKPEQEPEQIGCDYDEFVKVLEIFSQPEYVVDDELIFRIERVLISLGTAEEHEIQTIREWLSSNKGSWFRIKWD